MDRVLILCVQAANQQNPRDPAASGVGGKIEEKVGKAVGCEGMEAEGGERQSKAQ